MTDDETPEETVDRLLEVDKLPKPEPPYPETKVSFEHLAHLSEEELIEHAKRAQKEARLERRMEGEFKAAFMELVRSKDPEMRKLALMVSEDKCFHKKFLGFPETYLIGYGGFEWATLTSVSGERYTVDSDELPVTYEYLRAWIESEDSAG